jgi:hypothetical protein
MSAVNKYYATVLWGETPEPDSKPVTYTFDTLAERNAFELGMAEMDGYWGYDYATHEEPKKFKNTYFNNWRENE